MGEQEWSRVITVTLEGAAQGDDTLAEQLAVAVQQLSVPEDVRDGLQIKVLCALRQSCEQDPMAVQLTVFVQAITPGMEDMSHSWGFFVVEKGTTGAVLRSVDVFLYPETVQRTDERQP